MKRGVYIVNTARGAIIDTKALIKALESGIVAFAALDVIEGEPIGADHPLLKFKNVVITPHIGSATKESYRAMDEAALSEAVRIALGEKPLWALNSSLLRDPAKLRICRRREYADKPICAQQR